MALRLISALSVHRLTTGGDIYVPIGPTATELRDALCLYHPGIEDMGGEPATGLLGLVVTCLLEGNPDSETFAPARFRLEPDLLVTVLVGLVYAGDIVLAITGDKIDSSKLAQLAEHPQEDLKAFKYIEAPKEINVAVLRALFELLGLSPGLAQLASQGSEEPVKQLQQAVGEQVARVLAAGTDMQGRLAFWGQPLLRDDELRDWRTRLEALKTFTEALSPYNTVGKLKNLRIGSDDIEAQKKNLDVLSAVEALLALAAELGPTAAYLSQAELVLPGDHPWVAQAQATRKAVLDERRSPLAGDRRHAGTRRRQAGSYSSRRTTSPPTSQAIARRASA